MINKKKFPFLLFLITTFFYLSCVRVNPDPPDLKLEGVVEKVEKIHGFNGTGIIRIKITNSNVDYYDPRNKNEAYYCIIKNGYAEIYDGHAFSIMENDKIILDTEKDEIIWINDKGETHKSIIWVNDSDSFRKYLKEHHSTI